MELLIDSHHGQYIPKFFMEQYYERYVTNKDSFSTETINDLKSPDNEHYWESWDFMLSNARLKADNGKEGYLLHEDDLWWLIDGEELQTDCVEP